MVEAPRATSSQKTRVFISYARLDMAFADRLAAELEARGLEVLIDRQSLPALEDWQRELLILIRKADTVVFIVSERSIASPVCVWEVEQMAALDKRLAPVVLERVANDKIPAAITKINYLFFDPPNDFETQADALARALQTDIVWWHEHTRLVELASRWDRDGRPEGHLLGRTVLTAAQFWADPSRRPNQAKIPEVVFQFLDASLKKEEHDREELSKREWRISQQTQRVIGLEMRRAAEAHRYESAMRLGLSGEPSDDERARGITPEPTRHANFAASAQNALSVATLSSDSGRVVAASFSPGSTKVITAEDHTARLFDTATGTELHRLVHDGVVVSVGFSQSGALVITGSLDGTARIWDAENAVELHRLTHDHAVRSADLSVDSRKAIITLFDGTARIWDVREQVELQRIDAHSSPAALNSDATRVLIASNPILLLDAASGSELHRLAHDDEVLGASFSPNGALILSASRDKTARVWDTATGRELHRLVHTGQVCKAEFSVDSARVVTASWDCTARVWDVRTGSELVRIDNGVPVLDAAFSADGLHIVTTSWDRGRVWLSTTGIEVAQLPHGGQIKSNVHAAPSRAAFSGDGTRIMSLFKDGKAKLWHSERGLELHRLMHDGQVLSAAFTHDGARVVTASSDNTSRVWDTGTGVELQQFVHGGAVRDARFSGDGARVVTASEDKTARVWDAATGTELHRLVHDDGVSDAMFNVSGAKW